MFACMLFQPHQACDWCSRVCWLQKDPLIIPVSQQGHAVSLVKAGSLLSIGDRSKEENVTDAITIYYLNRPSRLHPELLLTIMYEKQSIQSIKHQLIKELQLQPWVKIPMPAQKIGNCS